MHRVWPVQGSITGLQGCLGGNADEGLPGAAALETLEVTNLSLPTLCREGGGLRPVALRLLPLLFRIAWLDGPFDVRAYLAFLSAPNKWCLVIDYSVVSGKIVHYFNFGHP
jgi:hypothetical protein